MKKVMLSLIVMSTIAIVGCKKNEVVPPPTSTSNLSSLFSDNENDAKQSFSIDASIWNSFTGQNGVKITVPPNSFVNSNGTTVTGAINLELIEVLKVSDMVWLNKTTTSNGELLVSGGQIKLTATQNSSQIFLVPGVAVQVKIPTANANNQMALFTGNQTSTGDVNWITTVGDTTQQDSIIIVSENIGNAGSQDYYSFDFDNDSLGWINCDYFYGSTGATTNVIAQLDTIYNYTNTQCYMVFPSINSVASLFPNYSTNNGTFTNSYSIPVGLAVTFVCISEIDGVYYSAFVNSTLVSNHNESISMTQTTLSAIQSEINGL